VHAVGVPACAISSSSGKRSEAERDPGIRSVTVEMDGTVQNPSRDPPVLPQGRGMDPRSPRRRFVPAPP